jgi:hypothetical protein
MNSSHVSENLLTGIRSFSGHAERRDYVGVSNIGKCPRQAYMDIVHGVPATDFAVRMGYAGRLFEVGVRSLLGIAGLLDVHGIDSQVVCPSNSLVKGHVDGISVDGDLIEIKSVSTRKWEVIAYKNRPMYEHRDQVLLYMHFGGWRNCLLIYVCRETLEHRVFDVPYERPLAVALERKILALAEAVQAGEPPACECKKCGRRAA